MKNQHGYDCPILWHVLPNDVNWVFINLKRPDYKSIEIVASKAMPYPEPDCCLGDIEWMVSNKEDIYMGVTHSDAEMVERYVGHPKCLQSLGKCIWQRPVKNQVL